MRFNALCIQIASEI